MDEYTTEYLILHESEIDWDSLSADKNRSFSIPEIRIFRKRINWLKYITTHNMNHNELEIASKYFSSSIYDVIALLDIADEEFIKNHRNNFNWEVLLSSATLSANLLNECFSSWKNISKDKLERAFSINNKINIHDGTYDDILLYVGLKF